MYAPTQGVSFFTRSVTRVLHHLTSSYPLVLLFVGPGRQVSPAHCVLVKQHCSGRSLPVRPATLNKNHSAPTQHPVS